MFSVEYATYLFALSLIWALLEIQIEGNHGWAEKLPCWRPKKKSLLAKLFAKAMDGKPLTGYHITMVGLVVLFFHLPFVTGTLWNMEREIVTWSALFLVFVFEDFLWFVWNPGWLSRFRARNKGVWWHKSWLGPVPTAYIFGIGISFLLALIALMSGDWARTFGILLGLTLVSLLIQVVRGRA